MKTIQKQIVLTVFALLLAAASASAQVLSHVYSFSDTNGINSMAGLLLSGTTLYGTTSTSATSGGKGGSALASGTVFKVNTDGTGFTNLHVFSADSSGPNAITNTDGGGSEAKLVLSGRRLYGTTSKGGFNANGIIFAINTDGTGFTNLYNFSAVDYNSRTNSDGAIPSTGLVLSGDTLYGTTEEGGLNAGGTVFAIHADGTGFTNLYSFTNDEAGLKGLILSGNTLYGTTVSGGSSGNGTVFALYTDGTGFRNLHSFSSLVRETVPPYDYTNSDGTFPQVSLVLSGSKLYGTTRNGGPGGGRVGTGTVFALNTDGTGFTILHSFSLGEGVNPVAGLVLSGNVLYGTTHNGGSLSSQQNGTVFAINTDGTGFATVHTFTPLNYDSVSLVYTNPDGSTPNASMIVSGSTLYGTTIAGGANGIGTVFALDLAVAPPTIQFTASPTNGVPPMQVQFSSPVVDSGGNAILGWNWNFGDGRTNSLVQNPTQTYSNSATFFPTLICINNNGDSVMGSGPAIVAAYPRSILNGGFESGTFTNWTQSGFSYSGVATGPKYAHAGTYGAALETGATQGFLSQRLTTTPGAVYLISFWLDSPAATKPNDFQVSWNGNVLLDKTNLTAIGWTNIQLTVTATASISTLQFGYLNGFFYFGLDDVSVLPVAQLGIAGISLAGADLMFNVTGGLSNRTYLVLTGTNLTEPFNQWTRVATNVAGADGNFNITATNAVTPNASQRFYILQLQ